MGPEVLALESRRVSKAYSIYEKGGVETPTTSKSPSMASCSLSVTGGSIPNFAVGLYFISGGFCT